MKSSAFIPNLSWRQEILYEIYAKTINIEANCMVEMAGKQIIPSVIKYANELAQTIYYGNNIGSVDKVAVKLHEKVSGYLDEAYEALDELKQKLSEARNIKGNKDKAFAYRDEVKVCMDKLRRPCDELEKITDKSIWPFPTYEDLLFEV